MLKLAFLLVMAALLLGTLLAVLHARATGGGQRPAWWLGVAHGLLGALGTASLAVALTGPERGVSTGVGAFGRDAIALLGAALAVGLGLSVLARRRHALSELVMILHGTLAVMGAVILLAYVSLA